MSRSELGELVRAVKDQLEWQAAGFASKVGVEGASALEIETFDADVRRRRQRAIDATKASFLSDEAEPSSQPHHTKPQSSVSVDPTAVSVPHSIPTLPDSVAQTPKKVSKPTVEDSSVKSLWKTTGSRPSTTFQPNVIRSIDSPWRDSDDSETRLRKVKEMLGDCTRCGLCKDRTQIVFGVGNPSARLMFIGEAPDFNEDKEGEPFVGKAGELLDKMIVAMGLTRSDVFIANVIKCRPPNNRDPESREVQECGPFLKLQIEAVAPEVIVTLGKFSSNTLTNQDEALSEIRGDWQKFGEIALMPTFHPSHLLRNPSAKRDAWSDLQKVMKKLEL